MASLSSRILLRDGNSIPIFGLGLFLAEKDEAEKAGLYAVKYGYRMLDTAAFYDNEEDVGKVVKSCGLSRDQLYVTTKLWYTEHGRESTIKAFQSSLTRYVNEGYFLCIFIQVRFGLC